MGMEVNMNFSNTARRKRQRNINFALETVNAAGCDSDLPREGLKTLKTATLQKAINYE
jgi:hypothetical protein